MKKIKIILNRIAILTIVLTFLTTASAAPQSLPMIDDVLSSGITDERIEVGDKLDIIHS